MNQQRHAYVDLQVNGYAGVDFNQDHLTAEQLHHACEAMQRDGVAGVLGTIITEKIDVMAHRLSRLVELRAKDALAKELIVGIHIEGPFINIADGYRGAHPADAVQPANVDDTKKLIDATQGLTRIFTMAPEQDEGAKVTRWLADQGVTVSAGHCDASMDQLKAGVDAGLKMYTHLGNGCPKLMDRHDNIVQRVLSLSKHLWLGFIADGVHVPLFALRNYFNAAGMDRCFVVSDCMAAAGLGPGIHKLGRWDVEVGEDLAAWAPGRHHLLGSAMTMQQAAANLREKMGLSEAEIEQLLVTQPRQAIGI